MKDFTKDINVFNQDFCDSFEVKIPIASHIPSFIKNEIACHIPKVMFIDKKVLVESELTQLSTLCFLFKGKECDLRVKARGLFKLPSPIIAEVSIAKISQKMSDKQLFVVGKNTNNENGWELQGIYDSEDLALANCKRGWWIGPVPLNTPLPEDSVDWEGAYYPDSLV